MQVQETPLLTMRGWRGSGKIDMGQGQSWGVTRSVRRPPTFVSVMRVAQAHAEVRGSRKIARVVVGIVQCRIADTAGTPPRETTANQGGQYVCVMRMRSAE